MNEVELIMLVGTFQLLTFRTSLASVQLTSVGPKNTFGDS